MLTIADSFDIAESKVFILYFIRKMDMPVDSIQLVKVILENRFMNYFYLQQYLSELLQEGLLEVCEREGGHDYRITDSGVRVLEMFQSILPAGLKKRLEDSISSIRRKVRMETSITADYIPEDDNTFNITCRIQENDFTLMEVKLTVGSREEAKSICRNWTNYPQQLYSEILDALMKTRDNKTGNA